MAEGLEIFQGIGPVTANRLAARLIQRGWSGWITPDLMLEEPSLVARQASIEALGQCMRSLRELADHSIEAVVRAVLERVVGPWIHRQYPDDAPARFDECAQLIQRIRDAHHLSDFLASLALDDGESESSGITLSTVHRAKGLEWAAVFVIGLFDGGFPLGMTLDTPSELEEERRLFYVALTRSRDWLTLVHSWESVSGSVQVPSRFVTELLHRASESLTLESRER